jgi:hypothetical protein
MEDFELVGELWRRRVEWMWKHWNAEWAPSEEVDVAYIDEQIMKDEANAKTKG